MRNRQKAAIMVALVVMAIVSAALLSDIYRIVSMPGEFLVVEGEERTLDLILPIGIFATSESEGILRLNGTEVTTGGTSINSWNPLIIQTSAIGGGTIEFRLFGLIPIKKLTVSVVSPAMVIPGGHS
ncbi:MAG TPA: hypothetical protein PK684_03865, partial [Bacillota bacterium]|nr:hypothetical protein [Bacillota bacterium]